MLQISHSVYFYFSPINSNHYKYYILLTNSILNYISHFNHFLFTDPAEVIQIRPTEQDQDSGKCEYYVHYDGCKEIIVIVFYIFD